MNQDIKEVLIIFKTHLDIGFCDLGETIVKTYLEHFIPNAIKRGYELKDTDTPFIWTVGSWLVNEALKNDTDGTVAKAIEDGIIKWHALPVTYFTEAMNQELFEYGLSLSQELDKRFGKITISSKMSDVPGHTIAMVPLMAKNGVEFLHLGANCAYPPIVEYPLFRWVNGEDEITVMYDGHYGDTLEMDDFVITFAFTNDNLGPQSAEEIQAIYQKLRAQYPNANVHAATLDDVAIKLRAVKDRLPVVSNEIGDLWIQNVGTDPKKVSIYKALLRHIEQEGIHADLSDNLLLIPEHTWGGDVKAFWPDYSKYPVHEFATTANDPDRLRLERSWQEKREYLDHAQAVMGTAYTYDVQKPDLAGFSEIPVPALDFEVSWQLFDRDNYRNLFNTVISKEYGIEWWVVMDNYKFGLPHYKGGIYPAQPQKAYTDGKKTVVYMTFDAAIAAEHGLPYLYAEIEENNITIKWFGALPNKHPQAYWMKIKGQKEENWQIRKLGQWIDAKGVSSSPLLHATDMGVRNDEVEIACVDSMLVAPYGRRLLDNERDPQNQDMYFNLYNNIWGCNHPMWYSDDSIFRFTIRKIDV